jgi:SAM-dependent methyltransferase
VGDDGGASAYILGTEERRRLELLEQCLDPFTTRSLDAIGVEPGWRCLEVGAGAGSVAGMLCERVGPAGRVAAVDLNTRFLEELRHENLDVHQQDVVADGLPGDAYDLVHARMLLMHLPTREKVLEVLAAALRPGGWLLIEDMDRFPLPELTDGLYRQMWDAAIKGFDMANVATTLGRSLPELFDRAGLEAVEPVCQVPVFRGGTVFAEMLLESLAQLRPLILASGMTEADLDATARSMADPTQWFNCFAIYSVRGRAPAA